jgi:hypothetical protein
MPYPKSQSPLDEHHEYIESLVAKDYSQKQIVAALKEKGVKTTSRSLVRAFSRWGLSTQQVHGETPGVDVQGDKASVISQASPDLGDLDQIIKDRGLKPEEWDVTHITVNEWDSPVGDTLKQLKVQLTRKKLHFFPQPATPSKTTKPKAPKNTHGELVVFTGDQQAPFHDRKLHQAFVSWLKKNKPAKGVLIGDTVDFPDISRHRLKPEQNATVQECINSGYQILKDYVDASPKTEWTKLCGNHDERIRNTLIDKAVELYGVKRAEIVGLEEASVLSVAHLLRLDDLGIYYLEPESSYEHLQINISPHLAARHGWIARKGSGASALQTLDHLGFSVVVGHTHRQGLVHKTTHDIDGASTTLAAAETGCMCQIQGGLGYSVAPNWQQGFSTAWVWPDGKFKIDLATYLPQDELLLWRDQQYGG